MTVRRVFPAAIAFVLATAFVAGSEPNEELHDTLEELRKQAARLQAMNEPARADAAPVDAVGHRVHFIPVEDVTLPVPAFLAPLRTPPHRSEDSESDPVFEALQPFGSIEEVVELVRAAVEPKAWEEGGIAAQSRGLVVHHRPAVGAAVRRFVHEELRPAATTTVSIDAELIELPAAAASGLAARVGGALDDASRARLESAPRRFAGRILALSAQTAVLRHGQQAALVVDADPKVADGKAQSDPLVDVAVLGPVLRTSATIRDDSEQVRIEYTYEHDRLTEPVRTRKTDHAGSIQTPEYDRVRLAGALKVPVGRWAVAGEASSADPKGARRFLLLRVRAPGRKGAR